MQRANNDRLLQRVHPQSRHHPLALGLLRYKAHPSQEREENLVSARLTTRTTRSERFPATTARSRSQRRRRRERRVRSTTMARCSEPRNHTRESRGLEIPPTNPLRQNLRLLPTPKRLWTANPPCIEVRAHELSHNEQAHHRAVLPSTQPTHMTTSWTTHPLMNHSPPHLSA